MSQSYINVIGAGLAGSEAAYQIAQQGIPVKLYEMRGVKSTPQHKTDNFAELVCSNSLRGDSLTNAVGLLKEEMRRLGSVILKSLLLLVLALAPLLLLPIGSIATYFEKPDMIFLLAKEEQLKGYLKQQTP